MEQENSKTPDQIRDDKKKSFYKGKWFWLFLFVILLAIFIFVFLPKKSSKDEQNGALPNNNQQASDGQQKNVDCQSRLFTTEFTDFTKIDAFQPLGSITGASRGRSYITIKKGETVPVYAPMDATLVAAIYAYRGPDAEYGEYGFKFKTDCGVTFLLDHLDSASDDLKKYAPAEPGRSTAVDETLSIPINAGTLLGYSNGTPQARTFDFLVMDQNNKASYINPVRWQWDQSRYGVCPYDFYDEDLKAKYYQKIGESTDVGFKKAQSCGSVSYDIANTISGGWFLDDTATDTKGEFMLIGERMGTVDVTVKTDSEGAKLRVSDYAPKILPKDIGIGESVCYGGNNNGNWAYLHLIDGQTIEINNGNGSCPASFPVTSAKKYYR